MTNDSGTQIKVVLSAVAALFAAARTAAYADDSVSPGKPNYKPGRSIEEESSNAATRRNLDEPGRGADKDKSDREG